VRHWLVRHWLVRHWLVRMQGEPRIKIE
jgi:hypothetical protein